MKLCDQCFLKTKLEIKRLQQDSNDLEISQKTRKRKATSEPIDRSRFIIVNDIPSKTFEHVPESTPQINTTPRICDLSPPHTLYHHNLGTFTDPQKRNKTIILPNGDEITDLMKLCLNCCLKAKMEMKITQEMIFNSQGNSAVHDLTTKGNLQPHLRRICDLSHASSNPTHGPGIRKDPNDTKILVTLENGELAVDFLRMCQPCFRKARLEVLKQQGARCALADSFPQKKHPITQDGFVNHPGGLTHTVTLPDGNEQTEIMKVCSRCAKSIRQELSGEKTSTNHQDVESLAANVEAAKHKDSLPLLIGEDGLEQMVKKENEFPDDPDCQHEKTIYGGHEFDNTLPILQDPDNPHQSMLRTAETKYPSIYVTYCSLPLSKMEKKAIRLEALEWIRLNEEDRDEYSRRLEELCEVTIPVDEDTPYRGRSVFAKRNIKKYEVIGPYAGALLDSHQKLLQTMRKEGSVFVESYLFQTARRTHKIHGFKRGNVLSLINTGSMIGHEEIAKNNLLHFRIGHNIIMILATRDIQKGEELFLDYGPDYNPDRWIKSESSTLPSLST